MPYLLSIIFINFSHTQSAVISDLFWASVSVRVSLADRVTSTSSAVSFRLFQKTEVWRTGFSRPSFYTLMWCFRRTLVCFRGCSSIFRVSAASLQGKHPDAGKHEASWIWKLSSVCFSVGGGQTCGGSDHCMCAVTPRWHHWVDGNHENHGNSCVSVWSPPTSTAAVFHLTLVSNIKSL